MAKDATKSKDGKKAKKAAKAKATPHCTCCGKHCSLSKPRCGKGRKLAAKLGI